jgi:hypothetical protein
MIVLFKELPKTELNTGHFVVIWISFAILTIPEHLSILLFRWKVDTVNQLKEPYTNRSTRATTSNSKLATLPGPVQSDSPCPGLWWA